MHAALPLEELVAIVNQRTEEAEVNFANQPQALAVRAYYVTPEGKDELVSPNDLASILRRVDAGTAVAGIVVFEEPGHRRILGVSPTHTCWREVRLVAGKVAADPRPHVEPRQPTP